MKCRWICISLAQTFAAFIGSHPGSAASGPVVDEQASPETIRLHANLGRIAEEHVLFGHQETLAYGYDWVGEAGRSDVREVTGAYPAVYGWDFHALFDDSPGAQTYAMTWDRMIGWVREGARRGGVITISWHLANPVTGGSYNDKDPVAEAILPGGDRHEDFVATLGKAADFFNEVAPIPVIFRPYHEHNGDWFWWGKGNITEEQFVELWRFTVEYLRDHRQVHNLLYAFSPDRSRMRPDSEEDYLYGFPGDGYVDILGLDNYYDLGSHWNKAPVDRQKEDFVKSLELIVRLAREKGKIPALTETGLDRLEYPVWWTQRLLAGIDANDTTRRIAYVLVWRNANREVEGRDHFHAPHAGHPGVEDFRAFKDSKLILFKNELPEWFGVSK